MYTDFYGLKEMPFSITPDSRFLYLSSVHREALGHLLYGIRERKGFILVTGEIGAGKTTLCRTLLSEFGPETEVAFIMNTFLTQRELLKEIVYELMAECRGRTKKDLIDQLNAFLLRSKSAGKNVVILIDEAQNLSPKAMEQVRMLSNLETERDKLLQIILVGQPEVRDILALPKMRQLDQRIAVRYHLRPLSKRETGEYIRHRLDVAGLKGGLKLRRGAVRAIYRYSGGTPRLINIICDRALLIGYVNNVREIGRWVVRRAESELSEAARREQKKLSIPERVPASKLIRAGIAAVFILVAFLGWANWRRLNVAERSIEAEVPAVISEVSPPAEEEAAQNEPPALPPDTRAAEKLLGLWGYDEPVSPHESIEGLAERSGLKTVVSWAELPFILKVNIPCILEVGDDYYVLERVEGDTALCWVEGEATSIPLDALRRVWDGRAIVLNRRVSSHAPLLYASMRGNDVLEIQKGLSELNYYRGERAGIFDKATKESVARFQEDYGINPDGIVGAETRLALWSVLAGELAPRLSSGGFSTMSSGLRRIHGNSSPPSKESSSPASSKVRSSRPGTSSGTAPGQTAEPGR